ncbi:MAG TPA: MscL family protein [Candidatus Saccharimonadales bacterium]|nr:MscL family protein [Candidatus Saccharimonadales bacterium]
MADEKISKAEARRIRAEKAALAKAKAKAKAKKVNVKAKSQVDDFAGFIRRQGVVGLAIGLVLGVQVKALVDQIVASFINPILGLILPGRGNLSEKTFALTFGDKEAVFAYGAFISVLISFTAVILIVYFGVKALKLEKLTNK